VERSDGSELGLLRVGKILNGPKLDLSDPFAGDAKANADLTKGVRGVPLEPEPEDEDQPFA
jgi:hypothetical protein